jgi:hypothetical protein
MTTGSDVAMYLLETCLTSSCSHFLKKSASFNKINKLIVIHGPVSIQVMEDKLQCCSQLTLRQFLCLQR